MDYEKKYKDALAHAREIHRNEEGKRKDMEFLFPELKGVDDKEIKEEIINYFECRSKDEPTRKDIHNKWIAWLKRQGNKPQGKTYTFEGKSVLEAINTISEKKSAVTQLDKNILEAAIAFVEHNNHFNYWRGVNKRTVLSALYSLKPQNTLKPSDEQMKALDIAIRCGIQLGTWEEKALKELREQLKKL